MAPVTVTITGVQRQPIDDSELVALIKSLCLYYAVDDGKPCSENVDIEGLVGELERVDQWKYTEQVRIE